MRTIESEADITVIGGGLAGICAAITAARQGHRVALVQNRPVLGGNSSSEVRVWVCGATAHGAHQWARETGVMGELWLENQYRNAEGNPYYWDLVLLEWVRAEPNITLWLNTDVRQVDADDTDAGGRRINSVTGWQLGSEKVITFRSDVFIDCSGDGLVGMLAGAEHMVGRESYDTYRESWAPEVPDGNTLGSTILFYTKDAGEPSPFIPPSFAVDIAQTAIPEHRVINSRAKGCAYWWIEWGGELDVVDDNERIRDELQAVVYGIWDHIKNSGEFTDVENLTLEWVGSVPGKREYRRFTGDYVMTQHDILDQTVHDDAVTFGGWSIDLHPPGGVYATEHGSKHWFSPGTYDIPLRSLYSRNVENMWVAGRNISASHVAFGSTRVMATCATIGEAAGLGAATALSAGITPRELAGERFELMRYAMVRNDTSATAVRNDDPADLAGTATVTASSTRTVLDADPSGETLELTTDLALIMPASPKLGRVELLLDVPEDMVITVHVHDSDSARNHLPADLRRTIEVPVSAGDKQWVAVDVDTEAGESGNLFLIIEAHPLLRAWLADRPVPGVVVFTRRVLASEQEWSEQFREWKPILEQSGAVFRMVDPIDSFAPEHVIGGYARPYGGPQMWASADLGTDPVPELQLSWDHAVTIGELQLVLDDDVQIDLINLHRHRTPHEVMPTLVRDYDIEARFGEGWRSVAEVRGNRHRHNRHRLAEPITTDAVRLRVHATNGAEQAHVAAFRAYAAEAEAGVAPVAVSG
ncbi:FAD-dependent oxidoreductase [Microlunatus sp. Y2014]|uniref:FAD-dependent oxidoreductase n=1 Tax=Microlunatus sp. Y2014 TaxID=3418488 RepID=UPI003DA6FC02